MDPLLILVIAAVGLLVAASAFKALLGGALRLLSFFGLSLLSYKMQKEIEGFSFLTADLLPSLGLVGGISFAITLGLMATLFRKSKAGFLLWPLIGFGVTFAAGAVVWTG
ncbi:MAG: hypothetical protein AAF603_02520 [Pseudomonadota bacterium]